MKKKACRWPEDDKTPLARLRGGLSIEKAVVSMGMTSRTLQRYEHGGDGRSNENCGQDDAAVSCVFGADI